MAAHHPEAAAGLALPGQADRLDIVADLAAGVGTSPAQIRTALSPVMVTAWIQDASGAAYQVFAAQPLPADGQPHSLVFTLSAPAQASYPLRLLGLTLAFRLPPYDAADPVSTPAADLTIMSLAAANTASGPFGAPFSHGAALAAWAGVGSSQFVPTGPPNAYGQLTSANGTTPAFEGWHAAPGGGEQFTFNTGHDPSTEVLSEVNFPPGLPAQLTVAVPAPRIIPVIATSGYLAANRLGIGSSTSVSIGGISVPVLIVAEVANFPTVFGPNRALIADLAELNDLLVADDVSPWPVNRWWLRTADGRVPRLPADLGLSVTSRTSQQAALFGNTLLTAPRQAMLAIGGAAVLLGVLGFTVSAAASLRSRRTQSAVFAALGVGKNAQAGQLCLEQCALSLPAAVAGLLAGIGLAWLLVPAITLTAASAAPLPWALAVLPVGPAVALALVTAALPVAAAALSVLRRPDPAVQLRAEAG